MELTERQWLLKGYLPKEGAKGTYKASGNCYGSCHKYTYFTEDEVELQLEKANAIKREIRAKQKAEQDRKKKYEDDHTERTSWQWLEYERRVPVPGANAHWKKWNNSKWYYYFKKDTVQVDDTEYNRLKDLYIKKFGGWECVDLESTNYDGRVWW